MKKIVLALALVGGTLAADAQVYLGGKLGLWSTKDKETNVTLAPEIGYKLSNNTGHRYFYQLYARRSEGRQEQLVGIRV